MKVEWGSCLVNKTRSTCGEDRFYISKGKTSKFSICLIELLENALFSKSSDSALCNLLLFYLDSIFKCYDEEAFEEANDSDNESNYEDLNESENGE